MNENFEEIMYAEDEESLEILGKAYRDPVYFAENFLRNAAGDLYKLEPHQKSFLRDNSSHRVLFLGRRMGKTAVATIDMMHKAIFTQNYKIMFVSAFSAQAERASEDFSDLLYRSEGILDLFTKDLVKKKRLVNGSKIDFSGAGKDNTTALIGGGVNYLFLDEAQDLPDEIYSKIAPVLRGQILGDPKLVFAGTPRGREGFFYNSINNTYRIFEDDSIIDETEGGLYSLHKKPTVYLDEEDNIIGTGTPRITMEELEEEKVALSLMEFKQEYALHFLDNLSKVFTNTVINECESEDPMSFGSLKPCVAGIDFGKINNNSVLFIGELDKYKNININYIHEWPLNTKYYEVTDFLKETIPKHYPRLQKLCMDATGVGQDILEHFDDFTRYEVEPLIFTQRSKIDMVENAVAMMESNKIKYPANDRFKKEMSQYQRELGKNGLIKYRKGESDDYVDAFILAIRAGNTVKPPAEPQVIQIGSNLLNNNVPNNNNKQPRNNQQNLYRNRRIRV